MDRFDGSPGLWVGVVVRAEETFAIGPMRSRWDCAKEVYNELGHTGPGPSAKSRLYRGEVVDCGFALSAVERFEEVRYVV